MKILFVYPNISGHENISLGIASLSSFLKKQGHDTDLMDYTWGARPGDCVRKVKESKPDIIGFSLTSGEFAFSLKVAQLLKSNFNIPIIFGGVHPTVAPEECINQKNVDMVCIGEGEEALAELLDRMQDSGDLKQVKNLWVKSNGSITRNPVRPLVEDLDRFPFPDRELFKYQRYCQHTSGTVDVMASRGCPFQCAYCINPFLQDLYRNSRKYVRYHSIDYVIDEISDLAANYDVRHINFEDDIFIFNKEWARDFLNLYSERFKIPFGCNSRVELLTEDLADLLKKAGCVSLSMGIESGSERIRREVLKRPISNEQTINAFRIARKSGLKVISFNMVGIPFETRADMEETVKLNRIIKPDYLGSSIFLPYPGIELHKVCKERGWIAEGAEIPSTHRLKATTDYSYVSRREIESWRRSFRFKVLVKSNIRKALLVLMLDTFYPVFAKIRARMPRGVKNFIFKVNRWLRDK